MVLQHAKLFCALCDQNDQRRKSVVENEFLMKLWREICFYVKCLQKASELITAFNMNAG